MSTPGRRVALVTGASGGIGAAAVEALAVGGHAVAACYRNGRDATEDLAAGLRDRGHSVAAVAMDVTDTDSVEAGFASAEAQLGPVGVVVANAGVTADGLAVRMTDHRWAEPLRTNLDGSFRVIRRALPAMMRTRWGRIVAVSSVVALAGSAGQANYAASKAAVVGMARSLAREVASRQITVNVVAPGPVDTAMLSAAGERRREELAAMTPAGRLGTPDEVAAAIAFLASQEASYVTGSVLAVDGGLGMGH